MFWIKQYLKMLLQNVLLPAVYFCFRHRPVRKGSVLFADGHHREMPFSMKRMYQAVEAQKDMYHTELFIEDFNQMSFVKTVGFLLRFMRSYATAEYVFICDYFLPAAACRKRRETTLVQLWHSCGLMKKIAFDAGQDIPKNYRGNMFGNYTWLTMSAPVCVPVHARALRMEQERIRATGICRTDYYFDPQWNQGCRERFFQEHPGAREKKIVLWAPTFRGNAAMSRLEGLSAVRRAAEKLGDSWYFLLKAHPHIDGREQVSNTQIPTEELLCVADLLITDYSSVLFDYLIYEKPVLLFAPDLKEYERERGFYIDYRSMPFPIVEKGEELPEAIPASIESAQERSGEIHEFRMKYTGACDGRAAERIMELAGMQGPGRHERRPR